MHPDHQRDRWSEVRIGTSHPQECTDHGDDHALGSEVNAESELHGAACIGAGLRPIQVQPDGVPNDAAETASA